MMYYITMKVVVILIPKQASGAMQVLRNAMGVGCVKFPGLKRYEFEWFNVIRITRGWVGVKFPGKSVTNANGPMLLALQGVEGCQISRKTLYDLNGPLEKPANAGRFAQNQ